MDQIKIGKFIAEERKAKKYTQRELADKLSISDKTISKWERGNGFPEVSLLLPLCNELEITVNEDEEIRMINEKLDFYVIERYFGRALFCHHLTDIQFFSES